MLWFAIELSRYLEESLQVCSAAGLPVRAARAGRSRAPLPGVLHRRRRGGAPQRGGRRAAGADAPPAAWPAWRGPRASTCARASRVHAVGRRRRRARRRQQRARRPGARRHRRLDERAAGRAHPLDPAGQRLPARADRRPAGLDLRPRRLRARRRRRRRPQGRRARGRRRRRSRRPRRARGSGGRGASASSPPRDGGYRAWPGRAATRSVRGADVCCYALTPTETADRRSHRRAHGRVRRLLGSRLQVRADGREGRGRPRARAAAGGRSVAVPRRQA